MKIHGTIIANLQGAITSASRLQGKAIYPETLAHWTGILEAARKAQGVMDARDRPTLDAFIARLQTEIRGFDPDQSDRPVASPTDATVF